MSEPTHSSQPNGHEERAETSSDDAGLEASLIDLVLIVLRNGRIFLATVAILGFLALLIALFSSSEYTSSAKVIRETETENAMGAIGGLALLRGMGLNLGDGSMGLTAEAYPDILQSREVRLAVVRDSFYFEEMGRVTSFVEYANRPTLMGLIKRYTIRLPGRLLESAQGNSARDEGRAGQSEFPSRQEEIAMKAVRNLLTTDIDTDTGLMDIAITTQDPELSSELASSFVRHLAERVEMIRTQKARQNLEFIQKRFKAAEDSLKVVENVLAQFDDRNNNPQSARLRTEQARLQRQVTFKSELYSDLQAQLMQAHIDYERSRPVITVLEQPVPPIDPSGPSRLLIIITGLMLGGVIGIGIAFTKVLFAKLQSQEEDKFSEIKDAIHPLKSASRMLSKIRLKKLSS